MRRIKFIFGLLFCLLSLAVQAQKLPMAMNHRISSVSDSQLPPVVRQKLLDFKFDKSASTMSGSANIIKKDTAGKRVVKVTYDYIFTLKGNQLSGNIMVTETIPEGAITNSRQVSVDLHDMLMCCIQSGDKGTVCVDADDDKAIKAAEKAGCTKWFKRVKPN